MCFSKLLSLAILYVGVRSLQELCSLVIVSSLLEQKSLELELLHSRLPDYVPPTLKKSISHQLNIRRNKNF